MSKTTNIPVDQEYINAGNRLIAEVIFGYKEQRWLVAGTNNVCSIWVDKDEITQYSDGAEYNDFTIPFVDSYHWLMEAVEKVEQSGHVVLMVQEDVIIKADESFISKTIAKCEGAKHNYTKKQSIFTALVMYCKLQMKVDEWSKFVSGISKNGNKQN